MAEPIKLEGSERIIYGDADVVPVARFGLKKHPVYGTTEMAILESDAGETVFLVVKLDDGRWTYVGFWPREAIAAVQKLKLKK